MPEPTIQEYERRNGAAISSVQKLNWTVILFLVAQTTGAIWWASSTHAAISYMTIQISELKADLKSATKDRYTLLDADRDNRVFLEKMNMLRDRVTRLERQTFGLKPPR